MYVTMGMNGEFNMEFYASTSLLVIMQLKANRVQKEHSFVTIAYCQKYMPGM